MQSRGSVLRAPRRIFQEAWTANLFARMADVMAENASSGTIAKWRWAVRLILTHAEKNGLMRARDITPAWLAAFSPQIQDLRCDRLNRSHLARLLLRLGLWSQKEYQLFKQNLIVSGARLENRDQRLRVPKRPPDAICHLVWELAYRCGLSLREITNLRVTDIQPDGVWIRARPIRRASERFSKSARDNVDRLIPFGRGWDELHKPVLEAYMTSENPTDWLLFSRSPRNKREHVSCMTPNAAVAKLYPNSTISALRTKHFRDDFSRARCPQEARFHFRNVHGLSNNHINWLIVGGRLGEDRPVIKGFVKEACAISIPAPYLLVAMCATRSIPEKGAETAILEGGKRHLITWHDLFGYEITVDWTRNSAAELIGRGRKKERAFRLLYVLALDFWTEGRHMRPRHRKLGGSRILQENRDLLDRFATTMVTVRNNSHQGAIWSGRLFEYYARKRAFRIPLIEEMNGHGWRCQCQVCWHPERENIEREASQAATKEGRIKGYRSIARKYGVSHLSLRGHTGRAKPPQYRGEIQRNHFSNAPAAPVVHCPRKFFEQFHKLRESDLMVYLLVLLEIQRAATPGLIASTQLIEQRIGLRLSESELSVALNHLGPTGAGLINFERNPQGFYIELCSR